MIDNDGDNELGTWGMGGASNCYADAVLQHKGGGVW
jgi:hypothetical protein